MGGLKARFGPVSAADTYLRTQGRRDLEDRERQEALRKAGQTGRMAAHAEPDRRSLSADDIARFGAQLRAIEERVSGMPRMTTLLQPEATQRRESRRFVSSLYNATQAELRLEKAGGDAGSCCSA
jgi:hypothetical protein